MTARLAPKNIDEFNARLKDVSQDLPKRMKQCATYVAENTERIAVSTVAEMASAAGVQPSAMMRFCSVMGFAGFSEMQKLFRTAYSPGLPDYTTRLANLRERGADSPASLLAEFVDAGRMSLENLANVVDPRVLDEAVVSLSGAQMIHVVGFRRAFPVATYLTYAFEKMEVPCMLHEGTGKLDHRHALRGGDAVIAISFAPYSQETVDLAQAAADRGLPVVAITDTVMSPLHIPGVRPISVSEVDFGSFRALSATLSLAITIAVAVGSRRVEK
ncbi:SIS domain-containing protein [Epibacterium sp. SM1979]|uniref:SIS domain-containing protein n=1 Tax=Tritonibacter litoralis TaxID=2662264 RepID=A0A843YI20_9RHOB|nr:MurR/RpiR family transcriptional regulator [Tritonibacter litoralis]MQQ09458.1 SIS domain-containing protein [Tritonibacter litoralis]